jgi:hypothetical protein
MKIFLWLFETIKYFTCRNHGTILELFSMRIYQTLFLNTGVFMKKLVLAVATFSFLFAGAFGIQAAPASTTAEGISATTAAPDTTTKVKKHHGKKSKSKKQATATTTPAN